MTGNYGPPQGDITIYNALQYFQSAVMSSVYASSLVPIAFVLLLFPPPRASKSATYWILLICLVFGIALGIISVIEEAHNLHGSPYVLGSVYAMKSITLFFIPIVIDSTILIKFIHLYPGSRPKCSVWWTALALTMALKVVRIGVTSAFLAKVHTGIDGFEPGEYINLQPWNLAAALRLATYCLQLLDSVVISSMLLYQGHRCGYTLPRQSDDKSILSSYYISRTSIQVLFASYIIPIGIRVALIATDNRSITAYYQGTIETLATSSLQYTNFYFSLYCAIFATLYSPIRQSKTSTVDQLIDSSDTSLDLER